MTIKRRWITLPIEIASRELDSKLLIAAELIQKGFGVIIGKQTNIHRQLSTLPTTLYLSKSIAAFEHPFIQRVKSNNSIFATLDEEGITYFNERTYIHTRYSTETISEADLIFSWGRNQYKLLTKWFPSSKKKIFVSGNPRIDFFKKELQSYYKETITKLNERFGNYILIPSNFSAYNHYLGKPKIAKFMSTRQNNYHKNDKIFYDGYEKYDKNAYYKFQNLIKTLTYEFPQKKIIARPHPSENHKNWENFCQLFPNVQCIFNGSITPWILAAEALIHHNCTSGVEAFCAKKKVICYKPAINSSFNLYLPSALSLICHSEKEVISQLYKTDSDKQPQEKIEVAKEFINNFDSDYSYKIIGNIISNYATHLPEEKLKPMKPSPNLEFIKRHLPRYKSKRAYEVQKYTGFTNEIIIKNIERINYIIGNKATIQANTIAPDIISLYSRLY